MIKLFSSFILLIYFLPSFTQEKVIFVNEKGFDSAIDSLIFTSNNDLKYRLNQLKNNFIKEGYFQFSIDSIQSVHSKKIVYYYKGLRYTPGTFHLQPETMTKDSLGFTNGSLKKILENLENNGYPFAEITVKKIELKDSIMDVTLELIPNNLVLIDSLIIKSENEINGKLIAKLIDIKPGDHYKERLIKKIDAKIKNTNYYVVQKNTEVLFTENGARIYMYLKKKTTNWFEGAIGLQPNIVDKKINITGNLNFKLLNNFQRDESISFNWKSLPSLTQELSISVHYPYIIFSNIGIKGSLTIYRQDTLFITSTKKIGFSYRVSFNEEFGIFFKKRNSFDQRSNNESQINSSNLTAAGLFFKKHSFDSSLQPKKGYSFQFSYAVGNRQTISQNSVTGIQHQSEIIIEKIIPIYNGFNAYLKIQENFQSMNNQLDNEMIRFGGFKTIRGFDELSIHATSMVITTVNMRYFLDQNTNIQFFYDQAWYERNAKNEYVTDMPYGLGIGFSFITNSGIFSFNYAIGSQFNNALSFQNGKIHFGFISHF